MPNHKAKELIERRTDTSWRAGVVLVIGDRSLLPGWCKSSMVRHRRNEIRKAVEAEKTKSNDGEMFPLDGGGALVWLRRDDKAVLVHELMHVAWHMLSCKGVQLTDETQEAYCYLLAYLFEKLSR